MSARMQFPLSQRRHTNVAVVRYNKNGVKLEIACYKNKIISFRSGTETRLDEVLQVERVFTNVSRGLYASSQEIQAAFGKVTSEEEAIKYMLEHGEVQIAHQERTAEVDEMFKDIAIIISQKCVNQNTQRPFPSQVIEQSLRSIGAGVKLDQPVKKQALALINQLVDSKIIPIARARMKIRCSMTDPESLNEVERWCCSKDAIIVSKECEQEKAQTPSFRPSLVALISPHLFRELEQFVKEIENDGMVHMIESAVMEGVGNESVEGMNRIHADPLRATMCGSSVGGGPTETTMSSDGKPQVTALQKKSGKKNKKSNRMGRNEDGSEDESENELDSDEEGKAAKKSAKKKSKKGNAGSKQKGDQKKSSNDQEDNDALPSGQTLEGKEELSLEEELKRLALKEEKEAILEEGKKGKKSDKKKNRKVAASLLGKDIEVTHVECKEEDSDEEVLGNRKQRKNIVKQKTIQEQDDDEENFDYYDE